MDDTPLRFWKWRYTDQFGNRRVTRYLLTEEDARQDLKKDPEKVEGSLELRRPLGNSGDFLKRS